MHENVALNNDAEDGGRGGGMLLATPVKGRDKAKLLQDQEDGELTPCTSAPNRPLPVKADPDFSKSGPEIRLGGTFGNRVLAIRTSRSASKSRGKKQPWAERSWAANRVSRLNQVVNFVEAAKKKTKRLDKEDDWGLNYP